MYLTDNTLNCFYVYQKRYVDYKRQSRIEIEAFKAKQKRYQACLWIKKPR